MNTSPQKVILSTEGFTAGPEFTAFAEEKAAKLLRHEHPRVDVVRLHLKRETPKVGAPFFSARATAEHAGPDHVVHAEAPEPASTIKAAVDKLERALTTAAGARKHNQHHPHGVEITANLPKIGAV